MSRRWSTSRIAFLVVGVICVAVGLVMILPTLGG